MIPNSACIVEMLQSEIVFCRKKGRIGLRLPANRVDKLWRTVSENAVTDRDTVSGSVPKIVGIYRRSIGKKTVWNACKNHGQTQNNIIGRSESLRTQVRTRMHANNAYFGSSGNAPACLLKYVSFWWGGFSNARKAKKGVQHFIRFSRA